MTVQATTAANRGDLDVLFVGWTSRPVRVELLPAVKAPANYKDPDKIAKYQEQAKARLMESAADQPWAAAISSYYVIDIRGNYVRAGHDGPALAAELVACYPDQFDCGQALLPALVREPAAPRNTRQVVMFGFGICTFLQVLFAEAILRTHEPPGSYLRVLTRSAAHHGADMPGIVDLWSIPHFSTERLTVVAALLDMTPSQVVARLVTASAQSQLARDLAFRVGMVSQWCSWPTKPPCISGPEE